jgi:hypothetical protein
MPGGGAAIKVSRTDQFAPEISKGRPSRRPFHIKPNPQRRFAGQSRQSAGQSDILFCNVRYWPARPTWKISKHAEIRENTSDTSSYALLLFGRKRRRQTRKDVVALPVAIHPVRRIWLWGFRYVLFEFGRRYLVICTADVRPKRYGNVANRHPRTPQLFRASRSRRRSQLPGHKDRSSARLSATPQAAPCPVEHREPLERHRQGKSRYWISCAGLRGVLAVARWLPDKLSVRQPALDRMLGVCVAHGVQYVQKRAQIQKLRRVYGSQLFSRLETHGTGGIAPVWPSTSKAPNGEASDTPIL